jgi:hypothetical protein
MTTMNLEGMPAQTGIRSERFRDAMVWLMFAVSFVVFIEPAPVDIMFMIVLISCWRSGLSMTVGAAPLTLLLIAYNIGGFISVIPVIGEERTVQFMITSTYMAVMGIFLSYYISYDPVRRTDILKSGLIVGAVCAAIFGLLDWANIGRQFISHGLIPGRATGFFKDPNVFSTYLILPSIFLLQGLMLRTTKHPILSILAFLIIAPALFLAYSRGAWINFTAAAILMVALSFIFNVSPQKRLGIGIFVVVLLGCATIAFMALMSVQSIRETFFDRFALVQRYDSGETGRFGNQLNAIPMLMVRPIGFGALQFHKIFGIDPHNTFIHAFASYGWLGGFSYILLVITSITAGIRNICSRTPWQNHAIAVFCPMVTTMLQGVQIDEDHWRHLYWMLGLNWGFFAATLQPSATLQFVNKMRFQRQHDT